MATPADRVDPDEHVNPGTQRPRRPLSIHVRCWTVTANETLPVVQAEVLLWRDGR